MTTLSFAMAAMGLLSVALALGRHYHHRIRLLEWRDLLSDDLERGADYVQMRVDLDQACIDDAMARARSARGRSLDDMVRLLQVAAHVVEGATHSRLERLRGMARATRMAVAMLPMAPVPTRPLRMPSTRALAFVARLAHWALLTTAERFWLRVQVLVVGLWLTGTSTRRTVAALSLAPAADDGLWDRLERALADRAVLDAEHVDTFRVLLLSLSSELHEAVSPAHR